MAVREALERSEKTFEAALKAVKEEAQKNKEEAEKKQDDAVRAALQQASSGIEAMVAAAVRDRLQDLPIAGPGARFR